MMDLDRFKEVNDSLGHHAGDEAAQAARASLAEDPARLDTSRLGGDEFGLLLPKHDKPTSLIPLLDKTARRSSSRSSWRRALAAIEASIGVALFPDDGEDVDTLLQHADVAMYAREGRQPPRTPSR